MKKHEAEDMAERLNEAALEPGRSYEVARNATCAHSDDAECKVCYRIGPYYVRMKRTGGTDPKPVR